MVNFNGDILSQDTLYLHHENRGMKYGDGLFETIRVVNGKIFFWEDHYLRLTFSMRIIRMEITMNFTMEFMEEQLAQTITSKGLDKAPVRVRLHVFRNNGGYYLQ